MESERIEWLGSTTCDICERHIRGILYDSKTKLEYWATLCHGCWMIHGVNRLGPGFGQKYQADQDGRFFKVEG